MAIILKIFNGKKTEYIEITKRPIVLGRSAEKCNFVVEDTECSSRHCELKIEGNVTVLKDLGSKNGTHVNGHMQKETVIYLGDEVKIGKTKLSLEKAKMTEEELNYHTLNVSRKQTQMININDIGLEKKVTDRPEKVKAIHLNEKDLVDKKKIEENEDKPWWKKIFK